MNNLPLEDQADQFAAELTDTLGRALPAAPSALAEVSETSTGRVVVRANVPLFVKDQHLANLVLRFRCELDSRSTWLAIEASTFELGAKVDRTPVIRFDFLRKSKAAPSAHVQVHAHRGALTHLLSQADHKKPHDMSALHIPLGGARFRPCFEDIVQFLIVDCGFDAVEGWQLALNAGRERWRRTQAKAVTRDFPTEAAETLRLLGYDVNEPLDGRPYSPTKALHQW